LRVGAKSGVEYREVAPSSLQMNDILLVGPGEQIGVKLLGEAKNMQGQYLPAIREKARTVNGSQIPEEVRQ
jgi:hypothetical protein